MFDSYHVYPFYHTYPGFTGWDQNTEQQVMEDLGYLQQMYPTLAKKIRIKVSSVLEKMDYEGSAIYDQYPDRIGLDSMIETIFSMMEKDQTIGDEIPINKDNKMYLKELATLVLYTELLKKRHKQQKYYLF